MSVPTVDGVLLSVLGVEVGKHLGEVREAIPLRSVCKEWRDTATLAIPTAELDLEPDSAALVAEEAVAEDALALSKRRHFCQRCPSVTTLTYHVSPRVCAAKFEAAMLELSVQLPLLRTLVLRFNNSAQTFEARHLSALARLPRLRSLSVQANFSVDNCSFAPLAALTELEELHILPSEACTGLTDDHVASLAGLTGLRLLQFPGHARGFTGATLGALASLPALASLAITSCKQRVDYCLAPCALEGLAAIVRRGPNSPALSLELGVPDAEWVLSLLAACATDSAIEPPSAAKAATAGLRRVCVSVREAASRAQVQALAKLPPASVARLAGLDMECLGALDADDVDVLGQLTGLERLHLTSKCTRQAASKFDLAQWASLGRLQHFHLHVNPGWRAPLQPATVAALAAAWPRLSHLHLRLCAADSATHALDELARFNRLRTLSLQWLGEPLTLERAHSGRRRISLGDAVASVNLGALPAGLQELSMTSISAVRVVVPGMPSSLPGSPRSPSSSGSSSSAFAAAAVSPVAASSSSAAAAAARVPELQSLSLDGNFGMSDELLRGLADALPGLRSLALVLAGRQGLSCEGLAAVGDLRELRALLVSDYRDAPLCLDQGCLAGLAERLGRLRSLKLSTHDIVHHELRPEVFAGFIKLRRLDLVGCADQAAAALGERLPLCCMRNTPEWPEDMPVKPLVLAAPAAAAVAAA